MAAVVRVVFCPRRVAAFGLALVLVLLPLFGAALPGAAAADAAASLRLVVLADTHWTAGGANRQARRVLAEIGALQPAAGLILHAGDITEFGAPEEYVEYREILAAVVPGLSVHHVPGNHDSRWLDAGKAVFGAHFGAPYRSFSAGPLHVVLLDSSIDAQHHGYFDPAMLEWLADDLARVGPETPVIIVYHHPTQYTPLSFTAGTDALYAVLAPYNVRGIFTGHGHLAMQWQHNDIPHFMVQAAFEGGYTVVDIQEDLMQVVAHRVGETPSVQTQLNLQRPSGRAGVRLTAAVVDAGELRVSVAGQRLPPDVFVWCRLNQGAWQRMEQGADGHYHAVLDPHGLPPGRHRVEVWAAPAGQQVPGKAMTAEQWQQRNLGPSWSDSAIFEQDGAAGGVRRLWVQQWGGGLQAAPAVGDGIIYVGGRDGKLRAISPADGGLLWQADLGGSIVGAPAVDGATVYVGTAAGSLHALDAVTGNQRWQYAAKAPLLAEPLVAGGQVIIGDSGGTLHSVDALAGHSRWLYAAGVAIRARATYGAGTVFVGAWDQAVHAVDAFTGELRWRQVLDGNAYYSPANAPFLYYRGRLFVTRSMPAGGHGLYALDARNGAVHWSAAGGFGFSSPVLHGGEVVAATGGGTLAAFDPMTGEPRWRVATGLELFDGTVVSLGGDLLVASMSGRVVAVAAGDEGVEQWRYATGPDYLFARPVPMRGMILAAAMDGRLHALQAPAAPPLPLTAGSPGVQPRALPAAGFADTDGHWAAAAVAEARLMGIVGGRPDGLFAPDAPLSRAELAALVVRYLGLSGVGSAVGDHLTDIEGHWAAADIRAVAAQGIVVGVPAPDGTRLFEPDRAVTRAEIAQVLARLAARAEPSPAFQSRLGDLQEHWGARAVQALEEAGLIGGRPGSGDELLFMPGEPVTRAEVVTLLMRKAFGLR